MTLLIKLEEGLTLDLDQTPSDFDPSCDCGSCEGCTWLRAESERLAFEAEQREAADRDFDTRAFDRVCELLVQHQASLSNRFLHAPPGTEKELARLECEQLPFLHSGILRLRRAVIPAPFEGNSIK